MAGKISDSFSNFAESLQTLTWTAFRMLVAAMFMTHGYTKLFGENPQPMMGGGVTSINIGELISQPMPMAINALFVTGVVEFFGGLLIFVGFWTRLNALIAAFIMLMAYLTAHLAWFPTFNRGEMATLYFLAFLIIFTFGAGPFSIDSWRTLRRQEKDQSKIDQLLD